jgi:hypothetical protein
MQSEQIMKPHGQVQQKLCSCEQALQIYLSGRRHLPFRPDFSKPLILASYDRLVNDIKRSFGEMLCRAPLATHFRSAEGIALVSSVMLAGPSQGCLLSVSKPNFNFKPAIALLAMKIEPLQACVHKSKAKKRFTAENGTWSGQE